jgi:hypothetical protein
MLKSHFTFKKKAQVPCELIFVNVPSYSLQIPKTISNFFVFSSASWRAMGCCLHINHGFLSNLAGLRINKKNAKTVPLTDHDHFPTNSLPSSFIFILYAQKQ